MRPRYRVGSAEAERIVRAFFAASRDGDVASLSALLARDVEIHSDGGGKVLAFRKIIRGLENALRLFVSAHRKAVTSPTFLRSAVVDGLAGYLSLDRNGALQTTALEIRDGRIFAIYIVKNPDKLAHVQVWDPEPHHLSARAGTTNRGHQGAGSVLSGLRGSFAECCRSPANAVSVVKGTNTEYSYVADGLLIPMGSAHQVECAAVHLINRTLRKRLRHPWR